MKRNCQSSKNRSISLVFANAGRISASTHSQMTRPPSSAAWRKAFSEASAWDRESVTTSSSTELSTAVNISRSLQISVHCHSFRKFAGASPFLENIEGNLFPSDELALDGIELEHCPRKKP